MERVDLERLSKQQLIELVLKLQQPEKTSRTSSKPPSIDRRHGANNRSLAAPSLIMRVMAAHPDTVITRDGGHRPKELSS